MIYPAVIGVDPGLSGAVAILRSNRVADVITIPFVDGDVDVPFLVGWINNKTNYDPYIGGLMTVAYIEKTWGFSKGGIAVSKLNRVSGILYGLIRALDIPVRNVAPATWRKIVLGNFRATKQDALVHCLEKYPELNITDHNKAEALCIAEYGFIKENGDFK